MTEKQIKERLDTIESIMLDAVEHRGPPGSPGVGSAEFVRGYDKGAMDTLNCVREWLDIQ